MTQLDVLYRYAAAPAETTMMALAKVREIYGIRKLEFSQSDRTVRVEYDATRLSEPAVHGLLRRTGLDIVEQVSLLPPQPEPEPIAAPAA